MTNCDRHYDQIVTAPMLIYRSYKDEISPDCNQGGNDPRSPQLVACINIMRDTWRANSETGVSGGRIDKTLLKIRERIIFFLFKVLQSRLRRSMFRSLGGSSGWQPIAESMDLFSGIYACTCTFVSTNCHFDFFQEPVHRTGSSFLDASQGGAKVKI